MLRGECWCWLPSDIPGKDTPRKAQALEQFVATKSILYWACSDVPKFAILLLYQRLFPTKSNQVAIHVLMGILAMHTISTFTAALIGWFPFDADRVPKIQHGVDNHIYTSLLNIVTDVLMLILPMHVVWKLHLSAYLKVGLTITFLVQSL